MSYEQWQSTWQVVRFIGACIAGLGTIIGGAGVLGLWIIDKKIAEAKELKSTQAKQLAEAKAARVSVLKPVDKVLLSSEENIYPTVDIGGAVIKQHTKGKAIFDLNGSKLLITIKNGQVNVTTTIYDKNGDIVAELVDNEWTVAQGKYFDRNYTKDALEVRGSNGDIILQIQVLQDRVKMQGVFYRKNGTATAFVAANGGGMNLVMLRPGESLPEDDKIKPMFKYPSETHFGEMVGN